MEEAELFKDDSDGFKVDLQAKHIRQVLQSVIEKEQVSADLRALCIQLMCQMGLVRANSEDLLRAALYQSKYSVTLLDQTVEYFCSLSEVYSNPIFSSVNVNDTRFDLESVAAIQNSTKFERGGDYGTARNQLLTIGDKYYYYAD